MRACPGRRVPPHSAAFAVSKIKRYVCDGCRKSASDDGVLGTECLVCGLTFVPVSQTDRAVCENCRYHLDRASGSAWLVTSAPTNEGAVWKGRYLPEASFRDAIADAVFEPGTIVEHYKELSYRGAYRICGAQSLAPAEMESQILVVVDGHRPRGDGRIFRP